MDYEKSCHNDSLCLHEYPKMIRLKKSDICSERKNWNGFYFSAESIFQESVSKQNFYACSKEKKNYVAPTFRLQSV